MYFISIYVIALFIIYPIVRGLQPFAETEMLGELPPYTVEAHRPMPPTLSARQRTTGVPKAFFPCGFENGENALESRVDLKWNQKGSTFHTKSRPLSVGRSPSVRRPLPPPSPLPPPPRSSLSVVPPRNVNGALRR